MRKKMNAFTLIELLAVIVILAIIALIATPIILGIVEDAKKDAFLRSVELVISTTDIDIANKTFEEEYTYEITDGNISNLEVSVKNTDGMNGSITYDVNGKEIYAIHNGVYCVMKTEDMSKAEISDYKEGECIIVIPTVETCFETEDIDGGVTITHYICSDKDVVIPSKIDGKTVLSITGYQRYEESEDDFFYTGAFSGSGITSVKFPNSLESIGDDAFAWGKISGELDLSNTNLTSVSGFYYNEITSVKFPSTLEIIEENAFAENKLSGELDLRYLTNLTSVSGFSSNEITSVKFPNRVTSIGGFYGNKLSGELDLSYLKNLISIGDSAFEGKYDGSTNQITSVKFPNSLKSIGENAFKYNKLSGELDLSNTQITSIRDEAFSGEDDGSANQITSIKFPSSVTSIGQNAFAYNKLSGELDLSNTQLTSIGDSAFVPLCMEDEETYEEVCLNQITSVKFPNTLESIGDYAFEYNAISGELDLSNLINLTSVSGFNDNEIISIKLPTSVISIGDYAFRSNKLSGELDLRNTQVTSIGDSAFSENGTCSYVNWDTICTGGITALKLPDTLNNISGYAFSENGIQEISMNYEEVEIGWGAFCGHQLSEDSQEYISINNINSDAFFCGN